MNYTLYIIESTNQILNHDSKNILYIKGGVFFTDLENRLDKMPQEPETVQLFPFIMTPQPGQKS